MVHNKYIAEMCRKVTVHNIQHNNANVMIISTDCIAEKLAATLVRDYLLSGFDEEERNMIRVGKISELEDKYGAKVQTCTGKF